MNDLFTPTWNSLLLNDVSCVVLFKSADFYNSFVQKELIRVGVVRRYHVDVAARLHLIKEEKQKIPLEWNLKTVVNQCTEVIIPNNQEKCYHLSQQTKNKMFSIPESGLSSPVILEQK